MTEQELAELDLAVAKAETVMVDESGYQLYDNTGDATGMRYRPTHDPAEAMRLLEKHRLELLYRGEHGWTAWHSSFLPRLEDDFSMFGETTCIAICKAVVALKTKPPQSKGAEEHRAAGEGCKAADPP